MNSTHKGEQCREELTERCALLEEKNRDLIARIRGLSEDNRANESLLRVLLENTPFGIVMFDTQRRVLQINRAAENLLGVQRVSIIGKSCEAIFNCFADSDHTCPVLDENKTLTQVETACRSDVCHCDRQLLRSVVNIPDSGGTVLVEAFVDISQIKQAQLEIENANKTKDNFLSKVSHELRTPLNAILGFTELLQDSLSEQVDSDNLLYLKNILRSSKDLLRMVDEILDITRLTAHRLTLDEYLLDIPYMVQQVCKDVAPQCEEHDNVISVTCADDVQMLYADYYRLHQILYHLLSNACKFTQQGEISVSVYRHEMAGQAGIAFKVKDNGDGMDTEQQTRIFTEFEQADSGSTRRHNGAGLGLTLCKEISSLMGGEILVTSELGVGAEFVLLLPDKKSDN